jgi:hypothetical protein
MKLRKVSGVSFVWKFTWELLIALQWVLQSARSSAKRAFVELRSDKLETFPIVKC